MKNTRKKIELGIELLVVIFAQTYGTAGFIPIWPVYEVSKDLSYNSDRGVDSYIWQCHFVKRNECGEKRTDACIPL